ncbi:hypothetical protein ACSTS3_15075 [Aquimarina muelleri]|uniref:hypothetical protein n=2 Tax=Aquimarina TaxID=290174 RepID=UPI003F685FF4
MKLLVTKEDIDLSKDVTFYGYRNTDKVGCLRRSEDMIGSAGFKTTSYGAHKDNLQMVKYGQDGVTLVNQPQIKKAKKMIDEHLENGKPIIVGTDWKPSHTGNADKTTDHWVVIVGRKTTDGTDSYLFFDPQTSSDSHGTSKKNLLLFRENGRLTGGYTTLGKEARTYTVTMVRPSFEK